MHLFATRRLPFSWLALPLLAFATFPVFEAEASELSRRNAAAKALKYLSFKMRKSGLTHASGYNGQVVVYATTGLAFLASGNTLSDGTYKEDIARCLHFIDRFAGVDRWGNKQWDQTVWGLAHSTIFLAHLHDKSTAEQQASIKKAMQRTVDLLVRSQTSRGGWCHGQFDVENALDYRDLVATTNLALFGLGLAKKQGVDVPSKTIDAALRYILASSDGKGQIGYSPRANQRGFATPGRNAATILAMLANESNDHKEFPLITKYFSDRISVRLNQAHGSGQLALLQAAWASHLISDDLWEWYWARLGKSILARQQPSGAFTPPESNPSKSELGDRATATHALILTLPEGRLKNERLYSMGTR